VQLLVQINDYSLKSRCINEDSNQKLVIIFMKQKMCGAKLITK
jgi:hypothetical protein